MDMNIIITNTYNTDDILTLVISRYFGRSRQPFRMMLCRHRNVVLNYDKENSEGEMSNSGTLPADSLAPVGRETVLFL